MRHRITATLLAAAAAFTGLATAAPAQAAGSVHLTEIYYNSPGSDNRSNSSLNAEWVLIKNSTSKGVSLKGWTLTDASSHKYTFGTYTLGAGKSVKIHTGKGTNTTSNRYQQRGAYVWNNDKDKATLKRSSGTVQDTCSYNSTKVSYKMC
ncbi:lamin tail domain-containing protein [Actinacidiphila oryziradicis]|uniref:Lamin tail domain-containing protein n=1 Tax=Actinacidiphila oryziradicis TaxID=2571141 RepID=A0A4U0R989_9ACTN|nr:lamin tail domain-containing protein [Actinacidiphila oryziradicis]TJZ91679.1 lamin tail domain-containing protein [Actinacidiphila oryziradicis]